MHSQRLKLIFIAVIAYLSATTATEKATTPEDVPYLVQLRNSYGLVFCTGALVSPSYVITTANCFNGHTKAGSFIIGGISNRDEEGETYAIEELFIPPEFSRAIKHMNIAVVKLIKPMTGAKFHPIGLCSKSLEKGDEIEVAGFGAGGKFWAQGSDNVNRGVYTVIPRDECAQLYEKQDTKYETIHVSDSTFCADEFRNIVGDHGGPAVHDGELCGVVSEGREGFPGVFTDIFVVKPFIENAMKG